CLAEFISLTAAVIFCDRSSNSLAEENPNVIILVTQASRQKAFREAVAKPVWRLDSATLPGLVAAMRLATGPASSTKAAKRRSAAGVNVSDLMDNESRA